ncbi:MAG TPA: hypothetical protein VE891_03140 [Allosphingosinicella sp.]|nr:hypothetical protein [Allosphingosinicella sp.]
MKSVLIAALLAAAPAEQSKPPCLTEAQVEDLALFALPPLLEAAAAACAPALPANAYLSNGGRTLARTLAAESSSRWAGASATLSTMAKDKFPAGLTETTARGLVHDLALGGLKAKGGQEHCGRINRVADLLSPLPPRNLAGLVVLVIEIGTESDSRKAKDKAAAKPPLICPAARP